MCPLLPRVQPELKDSPLWEEASFHEAKCHGLGAYLVPVCPSPDDVIIFGIESERVSERRWCINPKRHKARSSRVYLGDPLRERHPELGHAVDHGTGHPRFALLSGESASAQTGTDQGLVAEHRCLDERSLPVAH